MDELQAKTVAQQEAKRAAYDALKKLKLPLLDDLRKEMEDGEEPSS